MDLHDAAFSCCKEYRQGFQHHAIVTPSCASCPSAEARWCIPRLGLLIHSGFSQIPRGKGPFVSPHFVPLSSLSPATVSRVKTTVLYSDSLVLHIHQTHHPQHTPPALKQIVSRSLGGPTVESYFVEI